MAVYDEAHHAPPTDFGKITDLASAFPDNLTATPDYRGFAEDSAADTPFALVHEEELPEDHYTLWQTAEALNVDTDTLATLLGHVGIAVRRGPEGKVQLKDGISPSTAAYLRKLWRTTTSSAEPTPTDTAQFAGRAVRLGELESQLEKPAEIIELPRGYTTLEGLAAEHSHAGSIKSAIEQSPYAGSIAGGKMPADAVPHIVEYLEEGLLHPIKPKEINNG